jgi:NitT/TauT family transport system substrate-binding protein
MARYAGQRAGGQQDLIDNHPEIVERLVELTDRANEWANDHPEEAAEVVARQLGGVGSDLFPVEVADVVAQLEITPEVLLRSMARLDYTTEIDAEIVQNVIDYVAELGYINASFDANEILDLSFLD